MMYSQTLSYDSPLYGRRTGQIKMKQIAFRYYKNFFPTADQRQLIENYAVTGGVPKYIESFELYDNVYTAIERCVMSKESYLYEEPAFLLEKEVQDVGSYFSIFKTIASGKEKQSEIASALNVAQTNLPKYLKTLIDLDILEREIPATEDKPEKSKMGEITIFNIEYFSRMMMRFFSKITQKPEMTPERFAQSVDETPFQVHCVKRTELRKK